MASLHPNHEQLGNAHPIIDFSSKSASKKAFVGLSTEHDVLFPSQTAAYDFSSGNLFGHPLIPDFNWDASNLSRGTFHPPSLFLGPSQNFELPPTKKFKASDPLASDPLPQTLSTKYSSVN